jgi:hypothetical protein
MEEQRHGENPALRWCHQASEPTELRAHPLSGFFVLWDNKCHCLSEFELFFYCLQPEYLNMQGQDQLC